MFKSSHFVFLLLIIFLYVTKKEMEETTKVRKFHIKAIIQFLEITKSFKCSYGSCSKTEWIVISWLLQLQDRLDMKSVLNCIFTYNVSVEIIIKFALHIVRENGTHTSKNLLQSYLLKIFLRKVVMLEFQWFFQI